uniref:Aminopeptidase n=1 Tax=Plectus sambesii TaxID=2011161 RepID=A0A914WYI9_9BILA
MTSLLLLAVLLTAQLIHGQQQTTSTSTTTTTTTTTTQPGFQSSQQGFQSSEQGFQFTSQPDFQSTFNDGQFEQTTDGFRTDNGPINQVTINPGPAEIAQADVHGIVVENYNLRVQLPVGAEDGSEFPIFLASLTMTIRVVSETRTLVFNALHLNFSSNTVVMTEQNGGPINISNVISAPETETIALQTEQSLRSGQRYTIRFLRFSGPVDVGGEAGLFGSYVQDTPGGDQLFAMATQFQTNFARHVFPCLDTPKTKATFTLTIVHPLGTTATSNMEVSQTRSLDPNWNEATFATTPQLPTYLVAFAVLPDVYEVVEQVSPATGIVVRIRFNPREIYDPERLLEYALFALDALNTKFNVQLPLRKLDLVIIPNYSGAMENFGMMIFSQEFMKEQSEAMKLYIIAHEIVHHWVGDMATIGTWAELCVQEDLTDWYAYKVVDMWTGSRTEQSQGVNNNTEWFQFQLTNYLEVQTVETLLTPGESLLMLDNPELDTVRTRCYLKGVVLYKGLESLIGADIFEEKIRNFLEQFKFRSYRLTDFLKVFADDYVDGRTSVAQVFDFWYKNGGYPLLLAQRDYDRNEIRLTQANMGKVAQMGTSTWRTMPLWPLLITVRTPQGDTPSPVQVMVSAGLSIGPVPADRQQYVLINSDFAGFYRVNYDRTNWDLIQKAMQVNPDQFSPLTRAQLINDFCFFNAQGQVQNGEPLRQAFVKMVYNQPAKYDLCHWYMQSCSASPAVIASQPRDEARSLITDLMKQFNNLFTVYGNRSDYACQTQVVQTGNRICQLFFGGECYPNFS